MVVSRAEEEEGRMRLKIFDSDGALLLFEKDDRTEAR